MKTMIEVVLTAVTIGAMLFRSDGMIWGDWTSGLACGLMIAYWLTKLSKKVDGNG